jgi:uncharacterized Zn finger protein
VPSRENSPTVDRSAVEEIETAWRRTQGIPVWWNFETYKDKETAATIYYGKQLERE